MKRLDLVGQKFERLTVMAFSCVKHGNSYWSCECECGGKTEVSNCNLKNGHVKSCGCLKEETRFTCHLVHGSSRIGKQTRTYRIWTGIKTRCLNKNTDSYKDYGGRGIVICDRWKYSFKNFLDDMGECPSGLTIERINNNGNYEPDNCKWATSKEQCNNTRSNRLIEYNGEVKTLKQWADTLKIHWSTLRNKLEKYGQDIERAFTEPVNHKKQIEHKGETHTISQWAEILGMPRYVLVYRLNNPSWDVEKSFTTPAKCFKRSI